MTIAETYTTQELRGLKTKTFVREAPKGWSLNSAWANAINYTKGNKKIHIVVKPGYAKPEYAISEYNVWIPGCFSSLEAAILAFKFKDEILNELQEKANAAHSDEENRVIHLADLENVLKANKAEPRKRYNFYVGHFEPRRLAWVYASSKEHAFSRIKEKLDKEARRTNKEPPVAWDLELIE